VIRSPKRILKTASAVAALALASLVTTAGPASAWQDSESIKTPYGKLTSNVWYDGGSNNGSARKWNYQVSATVGGTQAVAQIKTTWTGGASMRNSASFTLAAGKSGVSAGRSSSWQYVSQTKYWSNTNGARNANYRTNMVAMPRKDYRSRTVGLKNVAIVKFKGDARNWQITAAA